MPIFDLSSILLDAHFPNGSLALLDYILVRQL